MLSAGIPDVTTKETADGAASTVDAMTEVTADGAASSDSGRSD